MKQREMTMDDIFGRQKEVSIFDKLYRSDEAEFVALYGRRRVGKTYLVRNYFQGKANIYFEFTGQKDAPKTRQLHNFKEELEAVFYDGKPIPPLDSWNTAFKTLATAIHATEKPQAKQRVIIFLDELPWMATKKSGVVQALDYIWNTQLSKMPQVILAVCGSAASWMIDTLIQAKGGLHNRITKKMRLMPFTLPETVKFLKQQKRRFGLKNTIEIYMAIGGVPHYLKQLEPGASASQSIANLCFSEDGILQGEFERLFRALFGDSDIYERIVRTLAENKQGTSREMLLSRLKLDSGGSINRRLKELEEAGFIARMTPYGKKRKQAAYRIIDPYVYFYLRWMESAPSGVFARDGISYWLKKSQTAAYKSWAGYAFENLCLTHAGLIKDALDLNQIECEIGNWSYFPPKGNTETTGAQIDLLFDRADNVISLCEIKFNTTTFSINKAYAKALINKVDIFQRMTRTRKDIQLVLITTAGFKPNIWSEDLIDMAIDANTIFGR